MSLLFMGERSIRLGEVTCHHSRGRHQLLQVSGFFADPPPARIDLVLRPSKQAATDTVDINSYWNQEMMYPNIPMAQP